MQVSLHKRLYLVALDFDQEHDLKMKCDLVSGGHHIEFVVLKKLPHTS